MPSRGEGTGIGVQIIPTVKYGKKDNQTAGKESVMRCQSYPRVLTVLLAFLLIMPAFSGCGENSPSVPEDSTGVEALPEEASPQETAPEETEAPDPFEDFDLDGMDIRMLVSTYAKGAGSSAFAIINEDTLTGEVVSDTVFNRNEKVQSLLNIRFSFTENDQNCLDIPATITKMVSSGDDAYELIIHDLFPLATLSVQDSFLNVTGMPYLDFTQPYWYESYMKDVSFSSASKRYILAGDYFLDIIRSAHALYLNKDRYRTLYGDPEELYKLVLDGGWTQDVFMQYSNGAYQDVNGNGEKDKEDLFGFSTYGYWGPIIPWVIGSDLTFLEYREDGSPAFALDNERSVDLMNRLADIFYGEGAFDFQGDYSTVFINGSSLFGGYLRVASIENFRDMEADIGILPIPKMDDQQPRYITSSHDTASVGVIPVTCTKTDSLGAVLEVLSRESANELIPAYYETALKTKYTRDNQSALILDLIRQNISCVFPLAFGSYCNNMPIKQAFSELLEKQSTDFTSNYAKIVKPAQKQLDKLWESFSANR